MLTWGFWKLLDGGHVKGALKFASWGADIVTLHKGRFSLNELIKRSPSEAVISNVNECFRLVGADRFDQEGITPLMVACSSYFSHVGRLPNPRLVELLLTHKPDPNRQDAMGMTALMYAANSCAEECLSLLLSSGADVSTRARDGNSALSIACSKGFLAGVRHLLARGADINQFHEEGLTSLSRACAAGSLETVRYLIQSGADINLGAAPNKEEMDILDVFLGNLQTDATPLMAATSYGRKDVVQYLLDHGADVNAKATSGESSLFIAVENGWPEITKILIESNANVCDRLEVDRIGKGADTILHAAVQSGPIFAGRQLGLEGCLAIKEQILTMLIRAGADIDIKNSLGQTAVEAIARWPQDRRGRLLDILADEHNRKGGNWA